MFFDRLGNYVTGEPIVEGAHSMSSDMVINFLSNIFYGTLDDLADFKTTTRDVNAIKLALEKTDLTDDEKAVLRSRFLKTPAEPRFSIGERLTDKEGAYAENWVRSIESKAFRKLRHPGRNAEFRKIIDDIRMRSTKPVRPGFEKPEMVQEGFFSFIKRDMIRQTIENYFHMPSIYWNILCWDESNKNGGKNMPSVSKYNGVKIDDKYSIKKMYNMHELEESCKKIGKGKEMYPIGTLNPSGYICLGKADETLYVSDDSYEKKISKFNSFITNIKIDEELSNFNPGSLEAVEKEFGVEFDDSFKSVFNKLIKTKPEAFINSGNCYFIEYESKYQSDFDKKHGYPSIRQFGYKFLDPAILLDWGDDYCDEDGCVCFAYGYPSTHCEDILLWVATKSCKKYKPGTIIESWDPPSNAYSEAEEIAPNLQSLIKKSKWISGAEVDRIIEDIVEYSEMDIDEMSDYIQEANEESKKARKNAQEFMRNEYGTSHPTSMTSKQRNRMKKWLKDNDYDPKTKTIKTDIIDKKTGKPFRVNLGTNITSNESPIPMPFAITPERAHQSVQAAKQYGDEDDKMLAKAFQKLTHDGRSYINMPKSYMKRHPSISNGVSKHEEGHVADLQYKRPMAGEKLANAATVYGFKQGLADDLHSNPLEYKADIYSVTHNKYKDKLRYLNAITSNDINSRRLLKKTIEKAIKELEKEYENPEDPDDIIESKDKIVKLANDSIDSAAGLVETFEEMIANGDHSDDTRRELSKYKKDILEEKAFLKKIENLSFKESKEALKQRYIADLVSDYKNLIAISNEVSDTEIKLRKLVAKKFLKEFATEYNMSTVEVIQEMYQTAFEDYVFQEDFEDAEFVSHEIILEEKINAADRKELDDSCFGLVYTDENGKKIRKYPLTDKDGKLDENHIRQAVRFFNHCPKEHQHQLALNILHAAHKLRLDTTKWDTVNKAAEENDED
jgi:hypothetical protein